MADNRVIRVRAGGEAHRWLLGSSPMSSNTFVGSYRPTFFASSDLLFRVMDEVGHQRETVIPRPQVFFVPPVNAVSWACRYCGALRAPALTRCPGCGANRG